MEHARAASDHPLIATATMGYGHLRAAAALVDRLGGELVEADRPPHASPSERLVWRLALMGHTHLSRWSQLDAVGRPFHSLLEGLTALPPGLDGQASLAAARQMDFLLRRGFGRDRTGA